MGTLALPSRAALLNIRSLFSALLLGAIVFTPLVGAARAADGAKPVDKPADAKATRTLGVVLYPRFELLDVYGPVEMFGALGQRVKIVMVGYQAGPIASAQGPKVVADYSFADCPPLDLLLVPGGFGTATQLGNEPLLAWLRERAEKAEIVMSVCSGSALLAKAGLLDGRRATSNKQFFQFAEKQGPKVQWVKEARWVEDGNRVTSSGVSAGMDMALAVIARLYGDEAAQKIADGTEYQWHRDANVDPFAKFAK
ncbi:MAG TPA: DJ-1/PfpI family protein [Pirellulales bacterium]|jgi:transcriptional regulator GlxA family with amidase domain